MGGLVGVCKIDKTSFVVLMSGIYIQVLALSNE